MKRGVGIAMQVGFGNLGGAISGFVYLSRDGPRQVVRQIATQLESNENDLDSSRVTVP